MVPDTTGAPAPADVDLHVHRHPPRHLPLRGRPAPGTQHQAAMGLYGALVVQPAGRRQAYATPPPPTTTSRCSCSARSTPRSTAREPRGVRHAQLRAGYFLINGKAYPDTDPKPSRRRRRQQGAAPLRQRRHPTTPWGCWAPELRRPRRQPLPTLPTTSAETFGPGQTADAIVTIHHGRPRELRRLRHEPDAAQQRRHGLRWHADLPDLRNRDHRHRTDGKRGHALTQPDERGVKVTVTASISDVASGNP